MSTKGRSGPIIPLAAGAALAVNRFVAFGAGGAVYSDTGAIAGITDRPAAMHDPVDVRIFGVGAVEAGGAFAAGAQLASDEDGKAVAYVADAVRHAVVDGAAANADIAVAGITSTDRLDAIVALDGTAVAAPTIHDAGKVRSTTNTTGKKLLVVWRPAWRPPAGIALTAGVAGDIVQVLLA